MLLIVLYCITALIFNEVPTLNALKIILRICVTTGIGDITISMLSKYHATKKLEKLADDLECYGIYVKGCNLQKAKLGTEKNYKKDAVLEMHGFEKIETMFFKDVSGQLKALRQLKSEMYRISDMKHYSYLQYTEDNNRGAKNETFEFESEEIIVDSEQAKQLLLKMQQKNQ